MCSYFQYFYRLNFLYLFVIQPSHTKNISQDIRKVGVGAHSCKFNFNSIVSHAMKNTQKHKNKARPVTLLWNKREEENLLFLPYHIMPI